METDDGPRRLNPQTIALLRKRMSELRPAKPAEERPLALIPVAAAPLVPPPNHPPAMRPPAARAACASVARGATPLLPGLGLVDTSPMPPPVRRGVLDRAYAKLSQPDAPLTDVVIFDTETTGTGPDARLVEIGALRVRDGKVAERFQTLVDPEAPIPPYVTRIHGIHDGMVKGAPRAKAVLRAFVEFVGDRPLMAHNAGFDRRIVSQELARVGLARPDIPLFCSLRLARKMFPKAPNHTLSTLARYLQIPDPPAHRAIADCMTTVGLLAAFAAKNPLRTLHVVHGAVTSL